MQIVDSYSLDIGTMEDDRYFGFVGEDWVWMKLSRYDASMCKDARGPTGRRRDPHEVAAERAASHAGSGLIGVSSKTAFRWKIRVKESQLNQRRIYALVMTHLFPKYVAVVGWAHGFTVMGGGALASFEGAADRYFELSWHAVRPMSELNQGNKAPIPARHQGGEG